MTFIGTVAALIQCSQCYKRDMQVLNARVAIGLINDQEA